MHHHASIPKMFSAKWENTSTIFQVITITDRQLESEKKIVEIEYGLN